jgi:hypothetical protein
MVPGQFVTHCVTNLGGLAFPREKVQFRLN